MTRGKQNIIVVGAGPVGLALALQLLRAGRDVTVLEKRGSVNLQSKASTFHASTLDLLETLGLLSQMRAGGVQIDHVQHRSGTGEVLAELDFSGLEGHVRNPFRLHYEQGQLSLLLAEAVKAEGGRVMFDAGVASVHQRDDHAQVVLESGEALEAALVFGCDGAQSAVRESQRIGYVEKPYPGMVLRLYADMNMRSHLPGLGGIAYLYTEGGACSLLEMPDCWRVILRVPGHVPEAEAVTDDWVTANLAGLLPVGEVLPAIRGRDVYRARRRRALSAGAGRIYLAGDALHLTNTKGGMNMNAGIHDAFALAPAAHEALESGDLTPLEQAAWWRERVARLLLIPRTDENVATGLARAQAIGELARNPAAAEAYLVKQAMLDMLGGIPAGLVGSKGAPNG
ncbi:MAG: NAD(P)/FAD-dependent oxidoreductase [Roseovarius sp.]